MTEHKIYCPPYSIEETAELPSIEEPHCLKCGLNYNRQIVPMLAKGNNTCIPKTQICLYCKKEFETLDPIFFCSEDCKAQDLAGYSR